MVVGSHPAAGEQPVSCGEKGQTQAHQHHHEALHQQVLLPEERQVLVPQTQELLLAVGVGHKLSRKNGKTNELK